MIITMSTALSWSWRTLLIPNRHYHHTWCVSKTFLVPKSSPCNDSVWQNNYASPEKWYRFIIYIVFYIFKIQWVARKSLIFFPLPTALPLQKARTMLLAASVIYFILKAVLKHWNQLIHLHCHYTKIIS